MMRRLAAWLALAALLSGLACARRVPERKRSIAAALFSVAGELGADPAAVSRGWRELDAIADKVDERHRRSGGDILDDFNAVVFGELGFQREIEDTDLRFYRLPSVLAERRGTCLGLADLYLAVGERLGIPLDGILLPGHFFVRSRERTGRAVELLRRGESMPEAWYRGKYGPWPTGAAYFRAVTLKELVALHWFNRGNGARAKGDLEGSLPAYNKAATDFPDFAEAQASLGMVHQLRGELGQAESAYQRAARVWPDLPGLAHNLELLKQRQAEGARPETN